MKIKRKDLAQYKNPYLKKTKLHPTPTLLL